MATRVAVDIGGTFTDLVYLSDGAQEVGLAKASTTPGRFEEGVMDAVAQADLQSVEFLAHGTTVVINTLTERKGAITALITTRGCRDVLEIQRGNRPDLFNVLYRKPEPFVPRRLRFEVDERLDYKGDVVQEIDEDSVRAAVAQAREQGAESIAICFLHAYANPAHEQRAAAVVRAAWPEAVVSASHELSSEWREFHRASTTVLNAYVKPSVQRYLERLADRLEEAGIPRGAQYAMQSNGGVSRFDVTAETPIHLVESGPVGGIIGAAEIGRQIGRQNLITLDIGGTTAKSSLIEGGQVRFHDDYHIERTPIAAGYPIKVPVVDIIEIGAGGGSIAWIDDGGALRVGPRSAGAEPGPAAYGRGGTDPTLTDANVVAGRIDPDYFLGGRLQLDPELSRRAFAPLAERLGATVDQTALGVIRLANANMVHLLRLVSVRRGHDPREFTIVACGGGGSMHAATLAGELGIREVLVPQAPGHFSALGMLMSDLRHDIIRTRVSRLGTVETAVVDEIWADLEQRVQAMLTEEGVGGEATALLRSTDVRYAGQEHTVTVPAPAGPFDDDARAELRRRFDDLHEQHYSFRLDVEAEIVNFRIAGVGTVRKPPLPRIPAAGDAASALKGRREVDYDDLGRQEANIYERGRLGAGATLEGPAVIEEAAASTLVLPGQRVTVDDYGNLLIRTEA
jgi:N-methylhydantoinase A